MLDILWRIVSEITDTEFHNCDVCFDTLKGDKWVIHYMRSTDTEKVICIRCQKKLHYKRVIVPVLV